MEKAKAKYPGDAMAEKAITDFFESLKSRDGIQHLIMVASEDRHPMHELAKTLFERDPDLKDVYAMLETHSADWAAVKQQTGRLIRVAGGKIENTAPKKGVYISLAGGVLQPDVQVGLEKSLQDLGFANLEEAKNAVGGTILTLENGQDLAKTVEAIPQRERRILDRLTEKEASFTGVQDRQVQTGSEISRIEDQYLPYSTDARAQVKASAGREINKAQVWAELRTLAEGGAFARGPRAVPVQELEQRATALAAKVLSAKTTHTELTAGKRLATRNLRCHWAKKNLTPRLL
jgi:hypothetical protein